MNSSVQICNATVADIPSIIQVAAATWFPTYNSILSQEQTQYMYAQIYNPEALQKQMLLDAHHFLLLMDKGEPTGFASFSMLTDKPASFKLHKLYVLPSAHGKGFGKLLIDEVVRNVKEKKGMHLYLNVNRQNAALQFYIKYGFTVHREEDIPIGPYWMNDYVLVKSL